MTDSSRSQASLFEPFERLGAERSEIEGTGIGLTITKKMVEIMGGKLGYETFLGRGSTFFIELPLHGESDQQPAPTEIPSPKTHSDKTLFDIFYIEDSPPNLVLVKETLSRIPHIQLDSALTGRQGLQKIREQLPNLILLDMGLPDMEGLDVIRELKKHSSTQKIPIMVLSASALKNQIDQAKALGIDHYLTKPFEINEFVDLIHQYSSQS